MNTASPRPRRRSSDTSDDDVTAAIELHRVRDPAAGSDDLFLGRGREHVLPGHQHRAAHVEPPERPRHEPDVEVRAAVSPAVEVDATRRRRARPRPARPDRTRPRRSRPRRAACRRTSRSGRGRRARPSRRARSGRGCAGSRSRRTRSRCRRSRRCRGSRARLRARRVAAARGRRGRQGRSGSAVRRREVSCLEGRPTALLLPDRGCRRPIKSRRTTRQPRATPCRRFTDSA